MSRRKSQNPDTGRDNQGRFKAGNSGGPGNPFNRRMAELRQAMLQAVTVEALQDIMGQIIVKARLGDLAAAKLVLAYAIGKPTSSADPDRVDLDEWKLYAERPNADDVIEKLDGSVQPQLANLSVKGGDLTRSKFLAARVAEMDREPPPPANGGLTASGKKPRPPKGGQAEDISITAHGQPGAPMSGLAPTAFLGEADGFLRHYAPLLAAPVRGLNGKRKRQG